MTLACRIHGALDLRLEPMEAPPPGPHEVRLRLGAGGICGSDLHYYRDGRVGAFQIREPLVPGHEVSGVVLEVGPAVTRVAPGDRVAIDPSRACGRCDACRGGRLNLCREMRFLGSASVFPHVQGLLREHFTLDERQLTAVGGDLSLGEIACAEPLSVGLHAVHRAGPLLGRRVLVMGAGTIGCMCAIAARLGGAEQVVVCDRFARPLEVAARVGADRTVLAEQADSGELDDGFEVAIEAAGSPAALAACLRAVRRGGRIVQVGTLPPEGVHFAANVVMTRELDYVGAFRAALAFDWAVQALARRRVDVRPLISAQLPLGDARAAFELAADRTRSTKVQLTAA